MRMELACRGICAIEVVTRCDNLTRFTWITALRLQPYGSGESDCSLYSAPLSSSHLLKDEPRRTEIVISRGREKNLSFHIRCSTGLNKCASIIYLPCCCHDNTALDEISPADETKSPSIIIALPYFCAVSSHAVSSPFLLIPVFRGCCKTSSEQCLCNASLLHFTLWGCACKNIAVMRVFPALFGLPCQWGSMSALGQLCLSYTFLWHSDVRVLCSRTERKQVPCSMGASVWSEIQPSLHLCTCSPAHPFCSVSWYLSFFFFFFKIPTPRWEQELLLSGRFLLSHMLPGARWTRNLRSFKPLNAHALACSHGSLK